jgi:hypothetical protein
VNIAKNLRVPWKLDPEDEGTIIFPRSFIDCQPVDTVYLSEDQDIQQHCCDSFRAHKEFLDQSNNLSVVSGQLSPLSLSFRFRSRRGRVEGARRKFESRLAVTTDIAVSYRSISKRYFEEEYLDERNLK